MWTGSRKAAGKKGSGNVVKYCSDRCRGRKPGAVDRQIESTFVALLNGEDERAIKKPAVKGDPRILVTCDEVEQLTFGGSILTKRRNRRQKNRDLRRGLDEGDEWKSVDMVDEGDGSTSDDDDQSDTADHDQVPDQQGGVSLTSDNNEHSTNNSNDANQQSSVESTRIASKQRQDGQDEAEKREMVRRAARRGVVFGFTVPNDTVQTSKPSRSKKRKPKEEEAEEDPPAERKKFCEAIMRGSVVEPSYAKGNWAIRWREE
ncbi:hypothetical protein LTR37_011490 [Vermiconidia calcicola]|uniref:Uncharacterized protein n=1 Tax=Vermiconidia calcicola TaxID=1690605 RepID=A0ACC3N208_9PEZI|nr:hypothetical protein LTR37_011490 [Vermiconidia calcicola]